MVTFFPFILGKLRLMTITGGGLSQTEWLIDIRVSSLLPVSK